MALSVNSGFHRKNVPDDRIKNVLVTWHTLMFSIQNSQTNRWNRQQYLFHENKRKARLSLAVLMDLSGPPILLEKAFEKQVGQKVKKTTTSSKVLNRKT
jgi:hypothetical protein